MYSSFAIAQRCGASCANPESLIGLSEQMLIASMPELRRLSKPTQGPRNSRGKWLLPDMLVATEPYDATIFMGSGRVSRIEFFSAAPRLRCAQRIPFELALKELGEKYGDSKVYGSFEDGGRSIQSAGFSTQSTDISLHFSLSSQECTTRIIYKARELKDASEL
jgi:hypothetical protein